MLKWIQILWPSFLVAGLGTVIFFTVVDPQQLFLFGKIVEYTPIATYSIAFFGFWLLCAASSLATVFFQSGKEEINDIDYLKNP